MIFFKIAFLNLKTHPRRTILILLAVAISVGVMETVSGMVDGMRENFFTNMLEESGHLQITPLGREESLNPYSLDYTIKNYEEIISRIQSLEGVNEVSPSIQFGAMCIAGERNITLFGNGIMPESSFNSKIASNMLRGTIHGVTDGILISNSISKLLNSDIGDGIILLVEDSFGSPFYKQYPITGIFDTNDSDHDENNVYISVPAAQEILDIYGEVSVIKIKAQDKNMAEPLSVKIGSLLKDQEVEIKTWREIHGNFILLIDLFDIFIFIMNLFTVVVAATVITNSILMNMFERVREFGTLRAVGLKKTGLFKLIVIEGISLGLLGSILGMLIGIPVVLYFQTFGLNYGKIMESFGMGSLLYFHLTLKYVLINFFSGILIAFAGSAYAAIVIIRKPLIDNLSTQ